MVRLLFESVKEGCALSCYEGLEWNGIYLGIIDDL